MTLRTGHMGNTFRHLAGSVDAVESARRFIGADGSIYEPLVALIGKWDFVRPEVAAFDGLPVAADAFPCPGASGPHGAPGRTALSLRIVGTYDGIGNFKLARLWRADLAQPAIPLSASAVNLHHCWARSVDVKV